MGLNRSPPRAHRDLRVARAGQWNPTSREKRARCGAPKGPYPEMPHRVSALWPRLVAEVDNQAETGDNRRGQGQGGRLAGLDRAIEDVVSGRESYQVVTKVVGSVGAQAEIAVQ